MRLYPFFEGSDDHAAGQPVIKRIVSLELAGCSGERREAGGSQLKAGRWRFGGGRRRLRGHPLQDVDKHMK